MNVILPNGTVIQGVPEGTTKEQIMQKAISSGLATEQDFGISAKKTAINQSIEDKYPYPEKPKPQPFKAGFGQYAGMGQLQNDAALANWETEKRNIDKLREIAATNPAQAELISSLSPRDKLLIGIGSGLIDIQRAAANLDQAITPEGWPIAPISQPLAPSGMKELEAVSPLASGGRMVGQALPFLPAGLAAGALPSAGGRFAAGSLIGGTEGAAIASGTGQDVGRGALVGAAIGGGAEVIGAGLNRILTPLVHKWFGKAAKALDDAGRPTPELNAAMEKEAVTIEDIINKANEDISLPPQSGELTPEKAAANAKRQEAFERFGLKPTEAQRTRDRALFTTQQDLYKTGGQITDVLNDQEYKLNQIMTGAVSGTKGEVGAASNSVIDSVVNRSLKADKRISDLYKDAAENAPKVMAIKFNNTAKFLRGAASEDPLVTGLITALKGNLEKNGALTGFNPTGRVSVSSAEQFRKYANELYNSTNDRGRQLIKQYKDAIDADVGAVMGEDFYKQARDAKSAFERGLDREKFNKFDDRNVNLVRDILYNKVTPDDITNGVLTKAGSKYKAQDLAELKRYFYSADPEDFAASQKAWNDIRAQAMQSIKEAAFGGPLNESGVKSLSRAGLEKGIRGIGSDKFKVLFNADERKFLTDLAELSRYKEPPSGTMLGSGPTGQAVLKLAEDAQRRATGIFGVDIPIASAIKGRMAEKNLLKINDDLAKLERKRLEESLKQSRTYSGVGAAVAIPSAAADDKSEKQ